MRLSLAYNHKGLSFVLAETELKVKTFSYVFIN